MDDRESKRDQLRGLMHRLLKTRANGSGPRFGDLAERLGYVDSRQLGAALDIQSAGNGNSKGTNPLLGEIMVDQGYLTSEQVSVLLTEQHRIAMSESEVAADEDEGLSLISRTVRAIRESP